jgi:hypothetical protein
MEPIRMKVRPNSTLARMMPHIMAIKDIPSIRDGSFALDSAPYTGWSFWANVCAACDGKRCAECNWRGHTSTDDEINRADATAPIVGEP